MKHRHHRTIAACLFGSVLASGCINETPTSAGSGEYDPGSIVGGSETGIGYIDITIAPVSPPAITNACYSIFVTSGDGRVVSGNGPGAAARSSTTTGAKAYTLCAGSLGDMATPGSINYVVPCDPEAPAHTVTIWVDAICESGPLDLSGVPNWAEGAATICKELQGYLNPCGAVGCPKTVTCTDGGIDAQLSFEFELGDRPQ